MSYIGYYEDCCSDSSSSDNPASNQYDIIERNSNFTAEKYKFYSVNTSNGSVIVELPINVENGDWFGIIDKLGTFENNNLVVNYVSTPIRNNTDDLVVDLNNVNFKLVYNNSNWNIFDMSVSIVGDSVGGTADLKYDVVNLSQSSAVSAFNYYSVESSADITLTLPSSPVNGDWLIVSDKVGNFSVNNVTISGAHSILGNADGILLDFNRAKVKLVYTGNNWDVLNLT